MNKQHIARTDYTNYTRSRTTVAPNLTYDNAGTAEEQVTISIRVTYPDFSRWRAYLFARQYPYLTMAICVGVFIGLVLGADVAVWLWHSLRKMVAGNDAGVI
jgi:hypothetical protein